MEWRIAEEVRCPFGDKQCPVINLNVEMKRCPLALMDMQTKNRTCAFTAIASSMIKLNGHISEIRKWGLKGKT